MSIAVQKPTIEELTEIVHAEHRLVLDAGASMVQHAIRAGEALAEIKERVPSGEWVRWLEDNFPKTVETATNYMRCAHYKDLLGDAVSLNTARRILVGEPPVAAGRPRAEHAPLILEMRDAGLKRREIAETLGLSKHTIDHHLRTPDDQRRRTARTMELNRKRAVRQRAARKALEREQRDSAMRKAGGDAWDAYVMTRKLAALLDGLGMGAEYAKCVAIEDALVRRVKES